MTTPKRPRDTNQLAKMVVDIATSDELESAGNGAPSKQQIGGLQRARNLLPHARVEIGKKAATARWSSKKKEQSLP